MPYGSSAAQDLLSKLGIVTADDEVRLLNGLLALGWDPNKVASFSDRDPARRYIGDAVTRALNAGIPRDQILRAIRFDEVARTEQDPVRRVQRLAEALGVDTRRIGEIAARNGGSPDAWVNAAEEVSRAGQQAGTQTLMGSDIARQTFRQYATFQPATYVGKGQAPAPGGVPTPQQVTGPPGSAGYLQQRGAPREEVAAAGTGAPTIGGQVPGPGGPPTGGGLPPPGGGTPPPVKLTPDQIRADIETRYGFGAAFMDIPEVARIINDAANGLISAEEANRRWLGSSYYKNTLATERNWKVLEKSSPGEAIRQLQDQTDTIVTRANALGVDVDPVRARQIAELSKRHGWSDQQIAAAIASEAKYDPTGAKTGIMAQIKGVQQNMLVPLSDQAMTQWAQAIIKGDQTLDDFSAYMKDQAKSLFPTLATYLDQTPNGNVKTYLDPYAQIISDTLGMPAGDIKWTEPKWFRFVNATNKAGERTVVDIADVQRTIIADPQYGFDQTTNGKQQKSAFAQTMLQDWGFMAGSEGGLR